MLTSYANKQNISTVSAKILRNDNCNAQSHQTDKDNADCQRITPDEKMDRQYSVHAGKEHLRDDETRYRNKQAKKQMQVTL